MTEEEKQLLLKDLCARLPYGTFAQWHHKALNKFRNVKIMKISTYGKNIDDYYINVLCQPEPGTDYEASIIDIKPYLRPMSSMTKEELKEYDKATDIDVADSAETLKVNLEAKSRVRVSKWYHGNDWLNEHHFDYRDLISMGLALKAPEGLYA